MGGCGDAVEWWCGCVCVGRFVLLVCCFLVVGGMADGGVVGVDYMVSWSLSEFEEGGKCNWGVR